MLFAFLAAIFESIYVIGTKKLLVLKERVDYSAFLIVLFVFLFFGTLILWPFFGYISSDFFQLKYFLLIGLLVILSVFWNILYYRCLHEEKLVEFELIIMVYPLATIFLASIFIPREFSIHIFIAGIVASIALILSHIKRKHIAFNKIEKKLLFTVFLMASEAIVARYLLDVMSSVSLYAIRTGLMLGVFLVLFRSHIHRIKINKIIFYQFLLALLAIAFTVFLLEGYIRIGVAFTILIMLLQPIITFIWAHFKDKEPFPLKKIIAAGIIIGAIVYAYLFK